MDLAIDFVRRCPEEYKQILFVLEDGQKRNIFLDHFVLKEGNRSVSRTNEISHVTKPLDEHLRALFRNNYTVQDLEVALRRVCETTDSVMHSFKEAVQRIKEELEQSPPNVPPPTPRDYNKSGKKGKSSRGFKAKMVLKEEVLSPSGFDSLEQCKVNTLLDKVGQICSGSETPRRKVNICLIGPGVNESVLNAHEISFTPRTSEPLDDDCSSGLGTALALMAAGGGHKSALRPHVHLSFIKVIKRKDATALIADLEAAVALELEASVPADIIVLCMTHLADHNSSNSQDNLMAYLMKKRKPIIILPTCSKPSAASINSKGAGVIRVFGYDQKGSSKNKVSPNICAYNNPVTSQSPVGKEKGKQRKSDAFAAVTVAALVASVMSLGEHCDEDYICTNLPEKMEDVLKFVEKSVARRARRNDWVWTCALATLISFSMLAALVRVSYSVVIAGCAAFLGFCKKQTLASVWETTRSAFDRKNSSLAPPAKNIDPELVELKDAKGWDPQEICEELERAKNINLLGSTLQYSVFTQTVAKKFKSILERAERQSRLGRPPTKSVQLLLHNPECLAFKTIASDEIRGSPLQSDQIAENIHKTLSKFFNEDGDPLYSREVVVIRLHTAIEFAPTLIFDETFFVLPNFYQSTSTDGIVMKLQKHSEGKICKKYTSMFLAIWNNADTLDRYFPSTKKFEVSKEQITRQKS